MHRRSQPANVRKPANTGLSASRVELRMLKDAIDGLSNMQHEELLKILQDQNIPFSQNMNGIFFTSLDLNDHVVTIMRKYIEFCRSLNGGHVHGCAGPR